MSWLWKRKKAVAKQEARLSQENLPEELKDKLHLRGEGDQITAVWDGDKLGGKEVQEVVMKEFAAESGIPFFEGEVEHAYSLSKAGNSGMCPRCKAKTRQEYASFVYAVEDGSSRVNTSPAGYFCTNCPTVIIDEAFIGNSVLGGHVFIGVIGMDNSQKGFIGFKTWNGSEPVYLLDENQGLIGILAKDEISVSPGFPSFLERERAGGFSNPKKKKQARKKNRSARASRKANRKKK